jgi:hypothetical protein
MKTLVLRSTVMVQLCPGITTVENYCGLGEWGTVRGVTKRVWGNGGGGVGGRRGKLSRNVTLHIGGMLSNSPPYPEIPPPDPNSFTPIYAEKICIQFVLRTGTGKTYTCRKKYLEGLHRRKEEMSSSLNSPRKLVPEKSEQ